MDERESDTGKGRNRMDRGVMMTLPGKVEPITLLQQRVSRYRKRSDTGKEPSLGIS